MSSIKLKRIYDPPDKADGQRILVDRLWPRGVSKDKARIDLWLKEIAPSDELRKWFSHDPAKWKEFQAKYRAELFANKAAVAQLKSLVHKGNVSLLYAAKNEDQNQAVVIRDFINTGR